MIAAMIGLAAAPARAAVIVHSVDVGPDTVPWSENVQLPQYDPAFGTLQSVQIRYTGTLSGDVGVENLEDKFNTIFGTMDGTFGIYNDLNELLLSLHLVQTGSQVADPFDFNLDYGGASGYTFGLSATGGNSVTYTSNLEPFIGLGTLQYSVASSDNSFGTAGAGLPAFFSLLSGSGTLEIVYSTGSVPEPSTLLTFGMALAGCLLFRRRSTRFARRF